MKNTGSSKGAARESFLWRDGWMDHRRQYSGLTDNQQSSLPTNGEYRIQTAGSRPLTIFFVFALVFRIVRLPVVFPLPSCCAVLCVVSFIYIFWETVCLFVCLFVCGCSQCGFQTHTGIGSRNECRNRPSIRYNMNYCW